MRQIERDGYTIVDWPDRRGFTLVELVRTCPELVIGRYLVNTSFDSGFLTLSEEEKKSGWYFAGTLAHSPKIHKISEIPHDQYDEWLVFGVPTEVQRFDTMVNFGGFTPIDYSWEEKLETYWNEILRVQPLHVLAENDRVFLVTREASLLPKLKNV